MAAEKNDCVDGHHHIAQAQMPAFISAYLKGSTARIYSAETSYTELWEAALIKMRPYV